MLTRLTGAALCAAAIYASTMDCRAQQAPSGFYSLESATILPGDDPDWDYLTFDPARSYLFIARRHAGVTVYDTGGGKVAGQIEESEDANGVVLVPEFDRGYTSNEDGSTTIFQLSTLKTIKRLKFGDDSDAAVYEPVTKTVAFMMGDSKSIVFVDAKTGAPAGKLAIDSSKLESPTADGSGALFLAERDKNKIVRIDAQQRKVTSVWPTTGCEQPTGMAMDRTDKRLFVGCRGAHPVLAVIDAASGKVITTLENGRGNDGVIYDPDTHRIFASNGIDANLTVFDRTSPDSYRFIEATTTRPLARTMALDPATKKIYTVTAQGFVDPAKEINRAASPFYPNRYLTDTFTLLTYSQK